MMLIFEVKGRGINLQTSLGKKQAIGVRKLGP